MNLSRLSIKQKFTFSLMMAVMLSTLLVGTISQWNARSLVSKRLETVELPNILMRIRNQIDKEISLMQGITEQLGRDSFIEQWMKDGYDPQQETYAVDYLQRIQRQYNLTNVSVADRQTARYWNQDGFLRVLKNDELDGWFYAFVASGQTLSRSLYTENGISKLFVNFQMLNGKMLTGIARTMDEMVGMLNSNTIAESGFVFVTDNKGMVMLHKDNSLLNKADLAQLYGDEQNLLQQREFNMQITDIDGIPHFIASSYIDVADWYVVAQVPVEEFFSELNRSRNQMIIFGLLIAIAMALIAFWMATNLTRPISRLANVFTDLGRGEANLDIRLESQSSSELSELQAGFNKFVGKIQHTVEQVAKTSKSLRQEASLVADSSHVSLSQGKMQSEHVAKVAIAVSEMDNTVSQIEEHANEAAKTADELDLASTSGQQVVNKAQHAITRLSDHIETVSHVIAELAVKTNDIDSILEVIRGVSDQTNLLALNAAIEAARAGEQGRGFAVVADEVRTLAQRTSQSTDEIQSTINGLQEEATKAVSMISDSKTQTAEGVAAVVKAEKALESITQGVSQMRETNNIVARSTEQQAVVTHEINSNLLEMQSEEANTLSATEKAAQASQELQRLSEQLDGLVISYR